MKFAHSILPLVAPAFGSLAATAKVDGDLSESVKQRNLQISTEAPLQPPSPAPLTLAPVVAAQTLAPVVAPSGVVFAGIQKYEGGSGADQGVETEVTISLEEDDQVTVVSSVNVGALVCDTLPEAVDADILLFRVTDEPITATLTSFTTVDGGILPDSETRHLWQGTVTSPEMGPDQAEASSVSMSWGVDCDVETFLWKMTTRMLDGTTKVLKSIPCEAGDVTDMCLVEVSLDLLEESEPPEDDLIVGSTPAPASISTRKLNRMTEPSAGMSTGRNLQGGTTVTVAMLYSQEALILAGDISPAQMVTTILEGLTTTNLAFENSGINMELELVYVGLLPYDQATGTLSALDQLRKSPDVDDIRNLYQADLVQLVGAFTDSCGRGYYYLDDEPLTGFSLVNPNCIDGYSHTHEFGHNLGCRHNRESTNDKTEYSHGLRYCDVPDEEKFRTIMAYECPVTQGKAPRLNYFSTPTIDYLGRPMGTATENNALTIMDNMAAVSGWRGNVPPPTPSPVVPPPTPSPVVPPPTPSPAVPPTPSPVVPPPTPSPAVPPPTPSPMAPTRTIPPATPPTPVPTLSPMWTEEGCFADNSGDRVLTGPSTKGDPDMTIEKCAGLCEESTYFGVQYSNECFCSAPGDDPRKLGPATCIMQCSGNPSQICGGNSAMNLFKFGDAYDRLGCFADSGSARVLSGAFKKNDPDMTTAVCADFCGSAPFFGTEYGKECFCGIESDDPEELGDAICDFKCAGNPQEECGGSNAITVYTTGDVIRVTGPKSRGCWTDVQSDRIMTIGDVTSTMTTKICEDICRDQTYFGTQYGKECWCGDADTDYEMHGQSLACTIACAGGGGDFCGGNNAMTVYEY